MLRQWPWRAIVFCEPDEERAVALAACGRIDGDFIDLKAIGTDVTEGKVADDAGGSAAGDASGLEQIGFARAVHAHVEVTIAP